MEIRQPESVRAVEDAAHLFDNEPDPAATSRFLASAGHHLRIAYEGDRPVGFVSGVELTHPDKGTEMMLYELGVDEPARNRGYGRALVRALADIAIARGCYGMFVLTDDNNHAALRAYEAAGGQRVSTDVMLEWKFIPE